MFEQRKIHDGNNEHLEDPFCWENLLVILVKFEIGLNDGSKNLIGDPAMSGRGLVDL